MGMNTQARCAHSRLALPVLAFLALLTFSVEAGTSRRSRRRHTPSRRRYQLRRSEGISGQYKRARARAARERELRQKIKHEQEHGTGGKSSSDSSSSKIVTGQSGVAAPTALRSRF